MQTTLVWLYCWKDFCLASAIIFSRLQQISDILCRFKQLSQRTRQLKTKVFLRLDFWILHQNRLAHTPCKMENVGHSKYERILVNSFIFFDNDEKAFRQLLVLVKSFVIWVYLLSHRHSWRVSVYASVDSVVMPTLSVYFLEKESKAAGNYKLVTFLQIPIGGFIPAVIFGITDKNDDSAVTNIDINSIWNWTCKRSANGICFLMMVCSTLYFVVPEHRRAIEVSSLLYFRRPTGRFWQCKHLTALLTD